jgi:hypothetical protein
MACIRRDKKAISDLAQALTSAKRVLKVYSFWSCSHRVSFQKDKLPTSVILRSFNSELRNLPYNFLVAAVFGSNQIEVRSVLLVGPGQVVGSSMVTFVSTIFSKLFAKLSASHW